MNRLFSLLVLALVLGFAACSENDSPTCRLLCGSQCCATGQGCDPVTLTCTDCTPNCSGKQCGPDGCGGFCGDCNPGTRCDESQGACVACTAECSGKQCGSDNCGGSCGECAFGTCSSSGQCPCRPGGQRCGTFDDCCSKQCNNGVCASCQGEGAPCLNNCCSGMDCVRGVCRGCKKTGSQCAVFSDCCSGNCRNGTCEASCGEPGMSCQSSASCCTGLSCVRGDCLAPVGKGCTNSNECSSGSCASNVCRCLGEDYGCLSTADCCNGVCLNGYQICCTPNCSGKSCGDDDGCGGKCVGPCANGKTCNPTTFVCPECVPNCSGKTCGPDGCNGSCGPGCGSSERCSSSGWCEACSCDGRVCGQDGCGHSCGGACTVGTCNEQGQCVMGFSSSFVTLPGFGSTKVEYRCAGTISAEGRRCSRVGNGELVELRIDGTVYGLFRGAGSCDETMCMSAIVPSGALFSYLDSTGGFEAFCAALGYSPDKTDYGELISTTGRPVAVVQLNPAVYGTAPSKGATSTYVECVK